MEGLTRGQLAQRAQINLETVRFYEQEGLLAPASRTASGYRKFEESAVDRLEFVRRAKALGFSLGEIRDLLIIQDEHADTCVEVKKLEGQLSAALRKCNQALKRQPAEHGPKRCPVLRQMSESKSRKD